MKNLAQMTTQADQVKSRDSGSYVIVLYNINSFRYLTSLVFKF